MSQREEDVSSPVPEQDRRKSTDSTSSQGVDTFEDAPDATSERSLTKRSASASKPPPTDEPESPKEGECSVKDNDDATSTFFVDKTAPAPSSPSSPASKRISSTSNLDNVNLDDDVTQSAEATKATEEKDEPSKTMSLSSIASALPSMPWSPSSESPSRSPNPPATAVAPPPPVPAPTQPAPPTRKLTSPFSWLSRNSTSKDKEQSSPPPQVSPRRNTASSVATLTSNPEMMLGRLDENGELNGVPGLSRDSLKDRFKMLRMREEAGITPLSDEEKTSGAVPVLARNTSSLPSTAEDAPAEENSTTSVSSSTLAPGTASGVNAGPSAMPEPEVDWDLWQSVVYEGPAAVARTSADELNRAIATGIPNAIRGVIWQVLAQSKSDGLETTFKILAVKGTDKEKRQSDATSISSASNTNSGTTQIGEGEASSASSVHSDPNGSMSPKYEKSPEALAKAQATAAAERKRKEKEDAATLQKLEKTIRRDLGARTSFSKYAAAAGLQDGLFNVCKAYALHDEGVGYAQGMNFLVMPLLFNMPEQEAFCMLVRLMDHYRLRDLFIQDMPGLHMHLYQFERLLEDLEPALYCHLHRRGISPHLYATQWFLTLFAYRFPLQLVLRIYDLILSEGLSAILRFGIVLMQKNAAILLGMSDMQKLTTYLKDKLFDVYIDKDPSQGSILESGFFGSSSASIDKEVYRADQLVTDACEVKLTPELLKVYTTEWEEKTKAEKDRETELLELRSTNHSFAIKLRKLEERIEVCDREQAALATELVHTKVENEEIKDENESLKGQVRELKVVIEKQPLEIEESWKLERDDLMKRNGKVHDENQKLEAELVELEEQLVQTKMRYAEINTEHETLTRKWTDLKRQFA